MIRRSNFRRRFRVWSCIHRAGRSAGFHLGGVAGGDRDHRHPRRIAAAGDSGRARSCPPLAVPEQSQADRLGDVSNYESSTKTLPPGCFLGEGSAWSAFILPYLEEGTAFDSLTIGETDAGNYQWAIRSPYADATKLSDKLSQHSSRRDRHDRISLPVGRFTGASDGCERRWLVCDATLAGLVHRRGLRFGDATTSAVENAVCEGAG